MPDIEERLALYPDLPPDARQALEEEVAAEHPALRVRLAEMQALARALGAGTAAQPLTPEALARYAAREHVGGLPVPEPVRERLQRDADARNQYYTLRDRVEALDRALPDPLAQFTALTGHKLSEPPARPTIHRLVPSAGRAPVPPPRTRRLPFVRYLAAACFGLVALYGGLVIASRASVSELDRLGALDPQVLRDEGLGGVVRGEAAASDPATNEGRYLRALDLIDEARHSTLGLFPGYDAPTLTQARRLLETVVLSEESGSFLQLEASYVLGKTLLLLGDEAQASPHLLRVVEYGGRQAGEAARILATLEARAG